jgi:hypothetical protein
MDYLCWESREDAKCFWCTKSKSEHENGRCVDLKPYRNNSRHSQEAAIKVEPQ